MESQEPAVVQNPEEDTFAITFNEGVAFLRYEQRGDKLFLLHTEVPATIERRGLGGKLAAAALNYARQHDLKVVPVCPFIKSYVERNPQYADLLFVS